MNHVLTSIVLVAACSRTSEVDPPATNPTGESWIRGNDDQRFALVAKHLRGFDVAMVETGYRYGELYWAGEDRNWDYAAYQLEKIETAVANESNAAPSARRLRRCWRPRSSACAAPSGSETRPDSRSPSRSSRRLVTHATSRRRCPSSRSRHRRSGSHLSGFPR